MRIERAVTGRWLATAVLTLLAGCGDTSQGGDFGPPGETQPLGHFQDGIITFYDATGAGNCSFAASPRDLDVAAINIGQYEKGAVCGSCAEIEGPKGTLRVRIVDSCPDCSTKGHLDLSRSAFAKIAEPVDGRVKVRWRRVACDTQGPVQYHFKTGSHQWWAGIQVRNHRLPITRLEYWKGNNWVTLPREDYNYFIAENLGTGEVRLRVTAMDGQTLEDTLPGVAADKLFDGKAQFRVLTGMQ
ncbi:MAG: expansin EXLX1 family cellulose-binding protein [Cystobacter sp.]